MGDLNFSSYDGGEFSGQWMDSMLLNIEYILSLSSVFSFFAESFPYLHTRRDRP